MRRAIPRFSNLAASDIQTRILGGPMFRIIAGNAWADCLKWGATRAVLLATALATGIFAGAMVNPQTAQAACNVPAFPGTPINVSCGPAGTTTTTVGQFGQGSIYPDPTAVGVWRVYPGTLSAQIDQGATVNGFGLDFVAAPGAALTVTNQGRVTTAEVGKPDSCCAALFMAGNGEIGRAS